MIDKPKLDSVTVGQVQGHRSVDDLLSWLKSLHERFDISMFRVDGGLWALEARKWYEGLEGQYNASCPEDYGTVNRGLCYLFALTFDQFSQELDRSGRRTASAPSGSGCEIGRASCRERVSYHV